MPSLPDPVDRECLPCYLYRVAGTEPCAAKLLGGFFDCEVLLNVFRPITDEAARAMDEGMDMVCKGTRRGSIQPCEQWMMRRGVQWGGGQFRSRSA